MKNVRIRRLRVFQAIMVGGAATLAGELLGFTQPTVSRTLQAGRLLHRPGGRSYAAVDKIFRARAS